MADWGGGGRQAGPGHPLRRKIFKIPRDFSEFFFPGPPFGKNMGRAPPFEKNMGRPPPPSPLANSLDPPLAVYQKMILCPIIQSRAKCTPK